MVKRNPNIYDVAKEARVSIATVSRFFNQPHKVGKDTAQKIQAVIESMNYSPNALAQGLVFQTTRTFGVVIANINNPFYGEFVLAVENTASEENYALLLGNTDNRLDEERKIIDSFLQKKVDGLIFAGGRRIGEEYDENVLTAARQVPVMLANHSLVGNNIYCILTDEAKGARLAVQHLIDTGRRSIAHIKGYANSYATIIKEDSYLRTLHQNGIEIRPELIVQSPTDDLAGGYEACSYLLEEGATIDALFAANDLMAIGALKRLSEAGYQVPQDIAVIGYDNVDLCNYLSPGLTSVSQNISDLGRESVRSLSKVLNGERVDKVTYLEPELIIRDSSS
jgi:LacI family transcriptional regulator/LacI family purine nucleotide synthesis repressor